MVCFAFASSNFGTLAMEQYGADRRHRLVGPGRHRDDRGAAMIGFLIGQKFDGTATAVPCRHGGVRDLGFVLVA